MTKLSPTALVLLAFSAVPTVLACKANPGTPRPITSTANPVGSAQSWGDPTVNGTGNLTINEGYDRDER